MNLQGSGKNHLSEIFLHFGFHEDVEEVVFDVVCE